MALNLKQPGNRGDFQNEGTLRVLRWKNNPSDNFLDGRKLWMPNAEDNEQNVTEKL